MAGPKQSGHRLTRRGKRRSAASGGYSKPLSRQHPVWRIRMCPPDGWRNEGTAEEHVKKITTRLGGDFWSGRRGSNSLPGIPRMADAIRRNPASPLDLTRSAPVEAASSSSPSVKFQKKTPSERMGSSFGAGDEARTRYLDLGKVALYQMSYARKRKVNYTAYFPVCQPCIFILRIL